MSVFGVFIFSAELWAAGGGHGSSVGPIPLSSITQTINVGIFVAILYWALFKKMNLPQSLRTKRVAVETEIKELKQQLEETQKKYQELQQRFARVDQEEALIKSNAEQQSRVALEKMRKETDALAAQVVEEARVIAKQEYLYLRERLVTEVIDEATERTRTNLKAAVDAKKDARVVESLTGTIA